MKVIKALLIGLAIVILSPLILIGGLLSLLGIRASHGGISPRRSARIAAVSAADASQIKDVVGVLTAAEKRKAKK